MKNAISRILSVVAVTLFMVGCSDKMEQTGITATGPALAGVETEMQSRTMILEAEDWDGVSPLEENRLYCIKNPEDAKRALADRPEALKWYEQQLDEIAASKKSWVSQKILPLENISRSDILKKVREKCASRPDIIIRFETLLNDTDLSHNPGKKPEPRSPLKLEVTIKESAPRLEPTIRQSASNKIKTGDIGTKLAVTEYISVDPYCNVATSHGTNGWQTYSSPVRLWVEARGGFDWLVIYTYKRLYQDIIGVGGTLWTWNATSSSDIGGYVTNLQTYTIANGLWVRSTSELEVYDAYWNFLAHTIGSEQVTWDFVAKGDCDLDGDIDLADFEIILDWYNHVSLPSVGNEQHAGDVDDDGDCDMWDGVAHLYLW